MVRWCHRCGAAMVGRLRQLARASPRPRSSRKPFPACRWEAGFDLAWLDGVQLVLKSPGLSPLDPGLSPLLAEARRVAFPVWGELEPVRRSPARDARDPWRYAPKILAITGTNGI